MSYYNELSKDDDFNKALSLGYIEKNIINEITDELIFSFRPYQEEALAIFDFFINKDDGDQLKQEIFEETDGFKCPYYGFEMATGSGKTILIAAFIIYLKKVLGVKNFLILTPPRTTIYYKTIKEFDISSIKCLFTNQTKYKYNLITGENYKDKTVEFDENADFNIYIFNISKFFESKANVKSVDKQWEESIWRDNDNNVISIRQFLKNQEDLVIITDEAHHFQKYTREGKETKRGMSSGDIIINLQPIFVIEFTATMIEIDDIRRTQKAIYKYPLDRYIQELFGKKIHAWGIPREFESKKSKKDKKKNNRSAQTVFNLSKPQNQEEPGESLLLLDTEPQAEGGEVTKFDQKLILYSFFIHILKRYALGYNITKNLRFKPILLIRARSKNHIENVHEFILSLSENRNFVLNFWNDFLENDKTVIVNHLKQKDFSKIFPQIKDISGNSFYIHYENRKNREIKDLFENIENNQIEVLVQHEIATEGWNIDNIYTILILSNSPSDIRTYIKQLIGRGLRLLKEKREFDDEPIEELKVQTELLHVVCDQGHQFESFVKNIRQIGTDLGLISKYFDVESEKIKKKNKIIIPDILTKYNDIFLPELEYLSHTTFNTETELLNKLEKKHLKLELFKQNIIGPYNREAGNRCIKYIKQRQVGIVDIITGDILADANTKIKKEIKNLDFSDEDIENIVDELIGTIPILPSSENTWNKLFSNLKSFFSYKFRYYSLNQGRDLKRIKEKFIKDLIEHIKGIMAGYLDAKLEIKKKILLKEVFPQHDIYLKFDSNGDIKSYKKDEKDEIISHKKDLSSYEIIGFVKSYFHYNQFDSLQEYLLGLILDKLDDVEFWIKNRRKSQFTIPYGIGQTLNPDFLVKLKNSNKIYVIEVKGRVYEVKEKTQALKDLNALPNNPTYSLLLFHDRINENFVNTIIDFDEIINLGKLK